MDEVELEGIVETIMIAVKSQISALETSIAAREAAFSARIEELAASVASVETVKSAPDEVVLSLQTDMRAVQEALTEFRGEIAGSLETLAGEAVSLVFADHVEKSSGEFGARFEELNAGTERLLEKALAGIEERAKDAAISGAEAAAATLVDGKDGVGFADITDTDEGVMFTTTDGRTFLVKHGRNGLDGVGISSVKRGVTGEGVVISTTDGQTEVVLDGRPGPAGRGIAEVKELEMGKEIVMTDGESFRIFDGVDGMPVDGKDGVGIKDFAGTDEGVRVTLTDGREFMIKHGASGADGVGLAGAFIDREGELTVTMTNGAVKALGRIDGKDGKDGEPGADGLGFDEFTAEFDGERTLELKFTRGDVVKSFPILLDIPIYKGFYKHGSAHAKGDQVTWAGQLYTAKRDTATNPDSEADWALTARRGRDGLAGKSIKGEKGEKGDPGRDLTQIGSDGKRW